MIASFNLTTRVISLNPFFLHSCDLCSEVNFQTWIITGYGDPHSLARQSKAFLTDQLLA